MVLAGAVSALKLIGGTLADHTFLFLGAGEVRSPPLPCLHPSSYILKIHVFNGWVSYFSAWLQAGTGIAELIALEISKQVT